MYKYIFIYIHINKSVGNSTGSGGSCPSSTWSVALRRRQVHWVADEGVPAPAMYLHVGRICRMDMGFNVGSMVSKS